MVPHRRKSIQGRERLPVAHKYPLFTGDVQLVSTGIEVLHRIGEGSTDEGIAEDSVQPTGATGPGFAAFGAVQVGEPALGSLQPLYKQRGKLPIIRLIAVNVPGGEPDFPRRDREGIPGRGNGRRGQQKAVFEQSGARMGEYVALVFKNAIRAVPAECPLEKRQDLESEKVLPVGGPNDATAVGRCVDCLFAPGQMGSPCTV